MTTGTTQPAAPAAPQPGTPEYDAAMVAKFEGQGGTTNTDTNQPPAAPQAPTPPAKLAGKFDTVDALVKSYLELQAKLGQPPATPPVAPTPTPAADPKGDLKIGQPDAQAAVDKAGLDFEALGKEFAENGDLKPETYQTLEKSGIPKPMVDAYIAGQKALAAQYDAAAHAEAGGADKYGQMIGWAKTNLSPAEAAAFDNAVSSGNLDQMKFAVAGLKARFEAKFGAPGTQVQGGVNVPGERYESVAQMKADMADPRYAKDSAFRARVEAKLSRSDILGKVSEAY